MENLQNFIKPELLVLIPFLYFVGIGIKKSNVKNEWIPSILGISGIAMSFLYVFGTESLSMIGTFTAITQGVLCAGGSVYLNQLIKQHKKQETEG